MQLFIYTEPKPKTHHYLKLKYYSFVVWQALVFPTGNANVVLSQFYVKCIFMKRNVTSKHLHAAYRIQYMLHTLKIVW